MARTLINAPKTARRGDIIEIDAETGRIDARLTDEEWEARRREWTPRETDSRSGAIWKYAQTVGSARDGAVTHPGGAAETVSYADV